MFFTVKTKKEKEMKLWKKGLVLVSFLIATAWASDLTRNASAYNLNNGVGLKSFDPVSFFPEGGDQGLTGESALAQNHLGVTYHFVNEENKELFFENTQKFEPTYGGWCAWAMANGGRVDIDPQFFTINGNRIHFFVNARAQRNFERDLEGNEARADGNWRNLSGEEPRI